MKFLIVEDDFTSRIVLQRMLDPYGECHTAEDGREALDAFSTALEQGRPFDLICLDFLMPELDGQEVLKEIRVIEKAQGIPIDSKAKVVVITGLMDEDNAFATLRELCDAYLIKPVDKAKLLVQLRGFGLIPGGVT